MLSSLTTRVLLFVAVAIPTSAASDSLRYDENRVYDKEELKIAPEQIVYVQPRILDSCTDGYVEVEFEVTKEGKAHNIKVLNSGPSTSSSNETEVVRTISFERWFPGKIKRKPVTTKGHRKRYMFDCANEKVTWRYLAVIDNTGPQ